MNNLQEIIKLAQGVTNSGLPIMEGRETGDIDGILEENVLVDNYEFGKSKDGEYVAFTIKGNDTEFFFGGTVVTETFKKLDCILTNDQKQALLNNGLETYIEEVKSKQDKRKYKKCTFFKDR